jgi:hypothetical protein
MMGRSTAREETQQKRTTANSSAALYSRAGYNKTLYFLIVHPRNNL